MYATVEATALAIFVVSRVGGGYGNMRLYADDWSIAQLLHVSKYPPSLSFYALELGCMAIILAGLLWAQRRVRYVDNGVLAVFGQTALFFYLLHITLLMLLRAVGVPRGGLETAIGVALLVSIISYPLCYFYRKAKRRYPKSFLRFVYKSKISGSPMPSMNGQKNFLYRPRKSYCSYPH